MGVMYLQVLKNIILYGLTHGLVDAACGAVIFAIPHDRSLDAAGFVLLVVLYDVLAFAMQPMAGFAADRLRSPSKAAAAGCLLTAFAAMLIKWPAAAICLAGVGNALFHVGGGIICLNLKSDSAGLAGAYVAPGAMGLFIGILLGKGGHFTSWIFVLMLITASMLILTTKYPEIEYSTGKGSKPEHFGIILTLLLASIAIRALVGLSLDFPWKSDVSLLAGFTVCVVLGKALGGVLADRLGWVRTSVTGLIISAPLLAFGAGNPYTAMVGIFMFNLTMPVTLGAVSKMFPGFTGFAFGLTALALIVGSLPAFTRLKPVLGGEYIIFSIIMASGFMLFLGLKLYLRGGIMEGKKIGKHIKFMVMLCMCLLMFSVTAYAADIASPGIMQLGIGAIVILGIIIVWIIIACILLIRWIVKKNADK